jgi:RNA polymerase sigma-70 factor (ECF subfamily)
MSRTSDEPDRAELEALLSRCAAGEAAALETLYARVAPILLAILMRMLKRRDLAEDVLQDVFVKVWQQASQFDPIRGRPLAWLVSMARYRAIDLQRAARPAVALSEVSLVLAYEEGLTHSEIARVMGEPLGTVKSWVRRSLLALRRCLGS